MENIKIKISGASYLHISLISYLYKSLYMLTESVPSKKWMSYYSKLGMEFLMNFWISERKWNSSEWHWLISLRKYLSLDISYASLKPNRIFRLDRDRKFFCSIIPVLYSVLLLHFLCTYLLLAQRMFLYLHTMT